MARREVMNGNHITTGAVEALPPKKVASNQIIQDTNINELARELSVNLDSIEETLRILIKKVSLIENDSKECACDEICRCLTLKDELHYMASQSGRVLEDLRALDYMISNELQDLKLK